MSAAPLKLRDALLLIGLGVCDFRARMSAAPLKLDIQQELAAGGHGKFPRSNERGPIEASRNSARASPKRFKFPRSNERGPIEVQAVELDDGVSAAAIISALGNTELGGRKMRVSRANPKAY